MEIEFMHTKRTSPEAYTPTVCSQKSILKTEKCTDKAVQLSPPSSRRTQSPTPE